MRTRSLQTTGTLGRRAVLAAAGLAWAVPGRAVEPSLRIRLSHVVAQDTPKGLASERFQALVMQRTAGRIQVEVYPDASLYGDLDEIEALQSGAIEMLAPSLSKFGRIGFPEFEVFDLPFLFDNMAEVRRLTGGAVGRRLLDSLQRQGLVGLGFLDNGFKHMSADRPLLEPADFAGLRMRVQGSRVIAAQMRALGALPVPLPFSATRDALAQGIVQGTENPLSNFMTQGMNKVQRHLTLTRHGYLGYAVITSQRFWSSLTPADRALLQQALNDALDYGDRIAGTQSEKALAELRAAGTTEIHELSPAQRAHWVQAVEPVYTQLGQRIGSQWVREVRQATHP